MHPHLLTGKLVGWLAGSKVWSLYSPAIPHARSDEARLDETELATLPDGSERPVEQEVVMKAGDMLYIPRGVPHTARNLRRHLSSTHLTVGTHVYLWQTLEGWAHRAAVLWLQRNRASSQARRLDEWLGSLLKAEEDRELDLEGGEAARKEEL